MGPEVTACYPDIRLRQKLLPWGLGNPTEPTDGVLRNKAYVPIKAWHLQLLPHATQAVLIEAHTGAEGQLEESGLDEKTPEVWKQSWLTHGVSEEHVSVRTLEKQ